MLPLMRLPVPANPNPEPLTYEGFRQILADFRDGDGAVGGDARLVPAGADIGVEVDLGSSASTSTRTARSRRSGKAPPRSWRALANNSGDAPDAQPRWCSASTAPTAIGCRAMPIS